MRRLKQIHPIKIKQEQLKPDYVDGGVVEVYRARIRGEHGKFGYYCRYHFSESKKLEGEESPNLVETFLVYYGCKFKAAKEINPKCIEMTTGISKRGNKKQELIKILNGILLKERSIIP